MRAFFFSLLIPYLCFSCDLREFCEDKIPVLEFLSFQIRNEFGKEDPSYWYMCGRIDSYYEILCYDDHPELFKSLDDFPYVRGEEVPDEFP